MNAMARLLAAYRELPGVQIIIPFDKLKQALAEDLGREVLILLKRSDYGGTITQTEDWSEK